MSIKTRITECIAALLTMKVHHIYGEYTSYKSALHEVRQDKIRSAMPESPKTFFLKKDFNVAGHYNIIDAEDVLTYRRNEDDVEYEITNIDPVEASGWYLYYRSIKDKPQVPDYLFLHCHFRLGETTQRFIATKMVSKMDIVYKRITN